MCKKIARHERYGVFTTSQFFNRGNGCEECGRILAFVPKAVLEHLMAGLLTLSGSRRLPVFTVATIACTCAGDYSSGNCSGVTPDSLLIQAGDSLQWNQR